VSWTTTGIVLILWPLVAALLLLAGLYVWLVHRYMDNLLRIFAEKPIFVIPRGQKPAGAEEIDLRTPDGLTLKAAYLKTPKRRRGVILFGLEFGSNRWSCVPYCEHLLDAGYDVFTYEPRNQGESDVEPGYEPLQWVTDREVRDCRAALAYLKKRADADPRGVGLFGISKGGGAGMVVAAEDPFIRCVLTDGAFPTFSVMVPYMRYWFSIYDKNYKLHGLVSPWYYGLIAHEGIRRIQRERGVRYPHLESAVARIAPRPLLMVHGEKDSYIKPSMALELYRFAREPKDFWLVAGARHNQAVDLVPEEYRRRVRGFFDEFLAG